MTDTALLSLACHDCDLLLTVPRGAAASFLCPRCRCVVVRRAAGGLDRAIAFYLTSAIFFFLANLFPIVRIEAGGIEVQATLFGAAHELWREHMGLLALAVGMTTLVIPAVEIFCTTAVLVLAETRHPSGTLRLFFRIRQLLRPWSMVEIFVLGALVAIFKLGSLASVVLGAGLWCLAAFMVAHAAASHAFDPRTFWSEIRRPL
jgi:paraquat-inducible protein A